MGGRQSPLNSAIHTNRLVDLLATCKTAHNDVIGARLGIDQACSITLGRSNDDGSACISIRVGLVQEQIGESTQKVATTKLQDSDTQHGDQFSILSGEIGQSRSKIT